MGLVRSVIDDGAFPILAVEEVVDAFFQLLASPATGECWFVVPGRQNSLIIPAQMRETGMSIDQILGFERTGALERLRHGAGHQR